MTRRRVLLVVLVIMAGTVAVAVLVSVIVSATKSTTIADKQATNSPKISETTETLRLVKDCVTPGGKCYERGQSQTAAAVGSLNEASVAAASAAAACAATPGVHGYVAIKRCVDRTLAADRP